MRLPVVGSSCLENQPARWPGEKVIQRLARWNLHYSSVWEEQQKALSRRKDSTKLRIADLEAKLSRLNDGFLEGDVDRDTYRRLYASLKVDLATAEQGGVETKLVQLDLEAVLQFAECLLSQPARWWVDASPEDKVKVQKALFPDGLKVDRDFKFSTGVSGAESMTYRLFGGGATDMASPRGHSLLWTPKIRGKARVAAA